MTYVFTRDVDDLSGGPRRAGGAGQPHSILASLALEDSGVSVALPPGGPTAPNPHLPSPPGCLCHLWVPARGREGGEQ